MPELITLYEFLFNFLDPEYAAYMIMAIGLALTLIVRSWGKSKGKTSAYGGDGGLNDIAISFIGNWMPARANTVIGGAQTFRAAWGARLLVGPIMLGFLYILDINQFMEGASADEQRFTEVMVYGVAALVLFQWIKLAFFVRIRIEDDTITSFGHSMRPQSRNLQELTGVALDGEKKLLKLQFADAPPLYTTRFISPRKEFIALLENRIQANAMAA